MASPGRPCPRHRNLRGANKMEPANRTGPVHVVCADDLAGRVAVVTGCGRGLGRGTALPLLQAGGSPRRAPRPPPTPPGDAAAWGAPPPGRFWLATIPAP